MAKDLLDFSKFKKIFEDDKNTHLQHPKGHTIIVAHVALSPKLKKQIASLPMHPEKMMELAQDIMEQLPHQKMAEGGEAKPFKGYNKEKHARTGGLNDAYREKYNREHGSNLKRPVTGKPEAGSKDAARKKSFCARMKGVKGPTSEGGELTPKGAALKRWNCHAHGGKIEDTDHDEECMHYAEGGKTEKPAVSRLDMHYKDVTKRIPELTEAANKVAAGEMSAAEYDKLVGKHKPVEAYGFVPQPASREDAMRALNESKRKMYGKTSEMIPGEPADLRLDIPAYKEHGVWVNSIHRKDAPTVYGSVSSVKNAQMVPSSEKALRVAAGGPKAPFAVIRGEWHPMEEQEAVEKAQKYLKHKDWKQVGYDPERHGYFYDRETMQPIEGAEQVIQIGPLVLAKKPKYGKKEEQLFAEGGDVEMYAKGGAAARKAAKEYDWNAPAGSQDLFRETPASMFDPEGKKLTKKAQRKEYFGPTGEPDPDTKQGAIYHQRQMKAIQDYMKRNYGEEIVPSKGKLRTYEEIVADLKSQNRKLVKAGKEPLPIPTREELHANPDFEKSPTTSTERGEQFYRSLLQKANPKPDWRSGNLEAQRNIGAVVHEPAHLALAPLGMRMGDFQEWMDVGSEESGRLKDPVTGESRQGAAKQTQREIQPMAVENALRNEIGIPKYGRPQYTDPGYGVRMTPLVYGEDEAGNPIVRGAKYEEGKKKGQYREIAPHITSGSMPRVSLDTQQPYATRLRDESGDLYDLIAQGKNMDPETLARIQDLRQGIIRRRKGYTPQESMSPDALINLRGQGRMAEAEQRLRTRGPKIPGEERFAEGGQVGFDAIKKEHYDEEPHIRHYAEDGYVEQMTPEEQANAPQDFGIDMTEPARAPASSMIEPSVTPMPNASVMPERTEPDFAKMVEEQPANPWQNKFEQYRKQADDMVNRQVDVRTGLPAGLRPLMTEAQRDEWALNKVTKEKQEAELQAQRAQMQQSRMNTYQQQLEKNNQAKMQALGIQVPDRGVAGTVGGGPAKVGEAPKTAPDLMGGGGPQVTPTTTADTSMDLYGPNSPYFKGAQEQIGGIYQEASALGKIARQRTEDYKNAISDQTKVLDDLRTMIDNSTAENNRIADDYMNERIDPMAVWNDKSVPGKISSAIGLILGGIGGGLTRQENPALKFLQYQIDKSVEAQKMRLGRYPTLLQNNLNQTNNMRQAMETTRAQIAEITAKKLEKAAAMYGDEVAAAQAMQAAGKIRQTMVAGPMMRSNVMALATSPSMTGSKINQLINQTSGLMPEVANDIRERYVPTVDAVADKKMSDQDINIVAGINNFEKAAQRLMEIKRQHPFTLFANLPTAAKKEVQSAAAALGVDLASAHGVEMSAGHHDFLMDQIGKPMNFYESIVLGDPRMQAVLKDLRGRKEERLRKGFNADRVPGLMNKMSLPSGESSAPKEIEKAKASSGFKPRMGR